VSSAYRQSIRVLSVLMIAVGVALLASALVRGGGPLTLGVLFGAALVALGVGRLVLARERPQS
jgi:hypothetical protein